jgi:catechol 2,3-dioxygenase-like lactoylglutathione lyase family enzyme
MKKILFFGLIVPVFLESSLFLNAQQVQRPAIWGIAKMTFLVSDFQMARDYYGNFLGFDEAFSYPTELGKAISFKVNDRQFLEFVQDSDAKEKKRLVSVSFETENVDQMRLYLKSKGQKVPDNTATNGAGNEVFSVTDLSGNNIEFIDFKPDGLHKKSKGQFLSERRISKRIHHVGLYAEKIVDNDSFYVGVLKFRELVRYPEDKAITPTILYLGMDDCIENIEHFSPNDENISHPCFLVDDMQETIYTLKERRQNETLAKPAIGKGKRWILNLLTPDQTKVEFTEAHCVR